MDNKEIFKKIKTKHSQAIRGSCDRYGALEIHIAREAIADIVKTLRNDPELAFNQLIDIVSIDYSAYPGWAGRRFGLAYLFKSLTRATASS